MREIQRASFSAIETALYLDTHPYDKEAIAALGAYCAAKDAAISKYEAEYGPITFCACSSYGEQNGKPYFRWATTPMPWELEDCWIGSLQFHADNSYHSEIKRYMH